MMKFCMADGWVAVEPLDIAAVADEAFVLELGAQPKYNGTVQAVPVARVMCNGLDVAYTLAGENATHAGTYVLTVKGKQQFSNIIFNRIRRSPRRHMRCKISAKPLKSWTSSISAKHSLRA